MALGPHPVTMNSTCGALDASAKLLNPFALTSDGAVLHASTPNLNRRQSFLCPSCREPLIHKRSTLGTTFFAHKARRECTGAFETGLHRYAKHVIASEKRLYLPPLPLDGGTNQQYGWRTFDRAEVEPLGFERKHGFRPDLVLYRGNRSLQVEVLVTHAVGEAKEHKVRNADLSMIEIDLSDAREFVATPPELVDFILRGADRRWVHNSAEVQLRAKHRRETKLREAESARLLLERALAHRPSQALGELSYLYRRDLRECGLARAIGLPSRFPHWFRFAAADWQRIYLGSVLFGSINGCAVGSAGPRTLTRYEFKSQPSASAPSSSSDYAGWIDEPVMRQLFDYDLIQAVNIHREEFGSSPQGLGHPNLALMDYQNKLLELGGILEVRGDRYIVDQTLQERIRRRRRLFHLLYRIVQSSDLGWKRRFIKDWVVKTIDGFSDPPCILTETGGIEWVYLEERLVEIDTMVSGGRPVSDILGLPVYNANVRARQAHS